jgi:hypothetical protein
MELDGSTVVSGSTERNTMTNATIETNQAGENPLTWAGGVKANTGLNVSVNKSCLTAKRN